MRALYDHPAFYDLIHGGRTHDLDWYASVSTASTEAVLDIGAGTGRVTLELARRGIAVTALEREPSMVERMRQRLMEEPETVRDRVEIVTADLRAHSPTVRHSVALCPHNGIAHQRDDAELTTFFDAVRRVLTREGRLYFDVPIPNPRLLSGHHGYVPWFRDPASGKAMRCTERAVYDESTRVLTFEIVLTHLDVEAEPECMRLELRQFFPEELQGLAEAHGFEVESREVIGDEIFLGLRTSASTGRF